MVLKVFTHPRQVGNHINPVLFQKIGRTDSGKLQQLR